MQLTRALAAGLAVLAPLSLAHLPDVALGLYCLSPALLLFVLLGVGRYPGERRLRRLFELARPGRARGASIVGSARRRADVEMPRGGDLLAAALAGRAPPSQRRLVARFSAA